MMAKTKEQQIIDEWDHYWDEENANTRKIYNTIAKFYRRYIIRRSLNHYLRKYIPLHSRLLHAGCGSGDVDKNIQKEYKITALDISPVAVKVYKKINGKNAKIIKGNIFQLPSTPKYDCIYNLGVMEHYSQNEIQLILRQFNKALTKNGYLLLFWPPEYGFSVLFFKFLVYILTKIIGLKKVKLHPNEISRIRSKNQAMAILKRAGLTPINTHFGILDLFTYMVVVAKKI